MSGKKNRSRLAISQAMMSSGLHEYGYIVTDETMPPMTKSGLIALPIATAFALASSSLWPDRYICSSGFSPSAMVTPEFVQRKSGLSVFIWLLISLNVIQYFTLSR